MHPWHSIADFPGLTGVEDVTWLADTLDDLANQILKKKGA